MFYWIQRARNPKNSGRLYRLSQTAINASVLDYFDVDISFWFCLDVRLFMRISYLALEFQKSLYRSNRAQLFYKIDVLKKKLTSEENIWVAVQSLQLKSIP